MKQLSFSIPNEHAFENAIDRLFASEVYEKATDVLTIAILGRQEPEYVERLIEIYKEREVKGTLCGYTADNALEYGICTKGGSNVTFFIFESGHADVRVYETEDMPEGDCGADLDKCLRKTPDAKALQIIPDIMHMRRLDDFLSAIHVPMDFPVVGASAGGQWEGAEYSPMFVFSDHIYARGILTIVYSGKELFTDTHVMTGWVPIGRMHTFTKLKSPTVVSEIDGLPATYIFRKYFNVEPDKYFYENTLGFPLYVKRNGEEGRGKLLLLLREHFEDAAGLVRICRHPEGLRPPGNLPHDLRLPLFLYGGRQPEGGRLLQERLSRPLRRRGLRGVLQLQRPHRKPQLFPGCPLPAGGKEAEDRPG